MKKILWILLALIVIVAGVFFIWWNHKPNFNRKIPREAKLVFCADIHNIRNTALIELSSDFNELLKEDTSQLQAKFKNAGLSIPDYLFGYLIADSLKSFFVLEFNLSSKKKFINKLKHYGFKENNEIFTRNNWLIKIRKGTAQVSYMLSGSPDKVLNFLNSDYEVLEANHEIIQKINQSDEHITVHINDNHIFPEWNQISVNFREGKIDLTGELNSDYLKPKSSKRHKRNEADLAYFGLNLNENLFNNEFLKLKRILTKYVGIELDKMFKNRLVLDAHLTGFYSDQDTVVIYDYDDNFDMVEVKQVIEKKVPNLNFRLSPILESTSTYLKENNFVKLVEDKLQLTAVPFVKLEPIFEGEYLQLTQGEYKGHSSFSSSNVMSFYLNIEKIPWEELDNEELYFINNKRFVEMTFDLDVTSDSNFKVTGELKAKEKNKHVLLVLKEILEKDN